MKVTAIKLSKNPFNAVKQKMAIQNSLRAAAEGARADFMVTTKTWSHQPQFEVKVTATYSEVSTGDETYSFVTKGTRAHLIYPRRRKRLVFRGGKYSAKTSPGVIGSRSGSSGSGKIVFSKAVRHPGSKARNFDSVIKQKWEKQFPILTQKAIAGAVGK